MISRRFKERTSSLNLVMKDLRATVPMQKKTTTLHMRKR